MTPGFRRQRSVDTGFYQLLFDKMRRPFWANRVTGPGGGAQVTETFTDLVGGTITTTGDPLQVALRGPGYLVVDTPAGERLTRNGQLTVDADGQLATDDGFKVQGSGGGGIDVLEGKVQISSDGTVLSDEVPTGRLRIIEVEDPHALTRVGHSLYRAPDEVLEAAVEAVDTDIVPESLELSNVQLPYEMLQMILGVRAYAANQRVIMAIDETASRLIDQVGTPV